MEPNINAGTPINGNGTSQKLTCRMVQNYSIQWTGFCMIGKFVMRKKYSRMFKKY